jgi:hypothetical protein
VDDPAVVLRQHRREHRTPNQHRALDEEVELGDVVRPSHLRQRGGRLRAGRVQHQHADRAEAGGDRGDQALDLTLVGDVGDERLGRAAVAADAPGNLTGLVLVDAVDGDRMPVAGQPSRDRAAQPARAPGHQRPPPRRPLHAPIMPSR